MPKLLARLLLWILALGLGSPAWGFDYAALKALIQDRDLRTIEDVLPQLPVALRQSFALVHSSGSNQTSSWERPRILLVSADGKLSLGISGDPQGGGHPVLEAIQFNDRSHRFEFHSIELPGGKAAHFTENNPACNACHGGFLHPNWKPYPGWDGLYGAIHAHSGMLRKSLSSPEAREWLQFLKGAASQDRYRFLPGLEEAVAKGDASYLRTLTQRNTDITNSYSQLNAERILGSLTEHPEFERYRPALVQVALDKPFLPVLPARSEDDERVLAELHERSLSSVDEFLHKADARLEQETGLGVHRLGPNRQDMDRIAGFRFIAGKMGLETQDWSLARKPGSYVFADGDLGTMRRLSELLESRPPGGTASCILKRLP